MNQVDVIQDKSNTNENTLIEQIDNQTLITKHNIENQSQNDFQIQHRNVDQQISQKNQNNQATNNQVTLNSRNAIKLIGNSQNVINQHSMQKNIAFVDKIEMRPQSQTPNQMDQQTQGNENLRKQKLQNVQNNNRQLSTNIIQQQNLFNTGKHKINLSEEVNFNNQQNANHQSKQNFINSGISQFEKIKGLTPISNKQNGNALKNTFHAQNPNSNQNSLHQDQQLISQSQIGLPYRNHNNQSNLRNNNHTRMPSLPQNIKGSVGGQSGIIKENGTSNHFVGDLNVDQQNKFMKFTGSGNQLNTANGTPLNFQNIQNGQKFIQGNVNNSALGVLGIQQQQQSNYLPQNTGNQTQKMMNVGQILKQNQIYNNQIPVQIGTKNSILGSDSRLNNQQLLQQKRQKAQSGLNQISTNRAFLGAQQPSFGVLANNLIPESDNVKTASNNGNRFRQQRVRSQLGQHQPIPLEPINVIQQSSSLQKHQNSQQVNQQVVMNIIHSNNQFKLSNQNGVTVQSRGKKSNENLTASGNRLGDIIEQKMDSQKSDVAQNQMAKTNLIQKFHNQQQNIIVANSNSKHGSPNKQETLNVKLTRPSSAQQNQNQMMIIPNVQKAGQSPIQTGLQSNTQNKFHQLQSQQQLNQTSQGMQGVQTNSQKLRIYQQQQLKQQMQNNSRQIVQFTQKSQPGTTKQNIRDNRDDSQINNEKDKSSPYTQVINENQDQPIKKPSLLNKQGSKSHLNQQQNNLTQNKISNVVTKFSFATKGGISAHNPYKTNQDAYITSPHIMGLKHCHFFSVCDGHGQNGREVSGLLKHRLPYHVEDQMKKILGTHDFSKEYPPSSKVFEALKEAFLIAQQEVVNMPMDTRYSGSTCVSVMTIGKKLFVANVGDSRGIVIKSLSEQQMNGGKNSQEDMSQKCDCTALTRDHKPDDSDEAQRIIQNNGRIDSYRDHNNNPLGPLRVWLKNEDIPGLAMTRSFGDGVAHSVGCNAIPEMNEYQFTKDDKVVVIASDGVWEFLQNIEVAKIIYPFYLQKNAEGAAENLVRASFKKWRKEESVIDDITCIVIFLDVK